MRTFLGFVIAVCLVVSAFAQGGPTPAGETASQFYLRYRAAVPAATTLQQIVEFWSADQRQDFAAAPAADRSDLAFVKSMSERVSNVKVVKESATPNTAALDVEAVMATKPVKTTVHLVREKEVWKIASGPEAWE